MALLLTGHGIKERAEYDQQLASHLFSQAMVGLLRDPRPTRTSLNAEQLSGLLEVLRQIKEDVSAKSADDHIWRRVLEELIGAEQFLRDMLASGAGDE